MVYNFVDIYNIDKSYSRMFNKRGIRTVFTLYMSLYINSFFY